MDLGAPELIIILALVFLFFGARKLPDLAKSLGVAKREFENGQSTPPVAPQAIEAPVVVPVAAPVTVPVTVSEPETTA